MRLENNTANNEGFVGHTQNLMNTLFSVMARMYNHCTAAYTLHVRDSTV